MMDDNGTDRIFIGDYPPQHHMLRDLGISLQNGDDKSTGWMSVVPGVCSDNGSIQVGVLATLIDIIGAGLCIRAVYPDWVATSSLSLYGNKLAKSGVITASGSIMRSGNSTIVAEVKIYQKTNGSTKPPLRIGTAFMSCVRLTKREDTLKVDFKELPDEVYNFATEGACLTQGYLEQAGVRVLEPEAGTVELNMSNYVRNSINCLQGGMVASLADIAGQLASREVSGKRMTTHDLAIQYLSQGKVGPFRTQATVLRATTDAVLSRVEVVDTGAENSLMAVAMNTSSLDMESS